MDGYRDISAMAEIRGSGQRRQALSLSGPRASVAAFGKFSARGGAPFVNAAQGLLTRFAVQRGAARWAVVGAAHAAGVFGDGRGQTGGH